MAAKAVSRPIKRTKKLSNNDLPDGVDLKTWRRSFVSTYMQYVGSSRDPWDIPAKLACEKMQLIWDIVFPAIEYDVTSTSTVYHIVRPPSYISTLLLINIFRPFSVLRTPGEAPLARPVLPYSLHTSNLRLNSGILMRIAWNFPLTHSINFGFCTRKRTATTRK